MAAIQNTKPTVQNKLWLKCRKSPPNKLPSLHCPILSIIEYFAKVRHASTIYAEYLIQ